jgi:predicted DNA-binding protein
VFSLASVSNGEKMYSQEVIKQYPVRLTNELQKDFERVSEETHINKTTLIRLAIENLIRNIDEKGIGKTIKSLSKD